MLLGVQIFGILFALFMIYITFIHKKRKEFTALEYTFWIVLWVIFLIVTIFPKILLPFTEALHLNRIMELLVILGFIFVIAMVFSNYVGIKKNQRRLEKIIRKIAYKKERDE